MTPCRSCARPLAADTAFCGYCGQRLSSRDPLVGTLLDGRYQIDAKIAAGGFGTIYRATHTSSGRQVALKVLHEQLSHDASVSARFRREAVAMSSLCDPHTVTTYELGEDSDGTRFIAMELLHGESLADRFTACGSLHWRTVLSILRSVCSSLGEAHALGIVHRDLKPANIFLCQQPTPDYVKVLDFGIAKILHGSNMDDGSELTRAGQMIGTLEYMSPEQLIGGELDGRTDIYTLGIVAYEMITGRRPFAEAGNAPALITALFTQTAPAPSMLVRVPAQVDQLLLRCLERDPPERFANVTELAAAIDRILAARPTPRSTTASERSCGRLQMIEPRRHAIVPAVAYTVPAPRPSPMPSFDVEVRGTVTDVHAYAARRWWLWLACVVIVIAGIAALSLTWVA